MSVTKGGLTREAGLQRDSCSDSSSPLPEGEPARLRVLYVDYSIGFGGAIKSLGLTLGKLAGVEPLLLTTQKPDLVERWLPQCRVWYFRRWVNYRSIAAVIEWADRHVRLRGVRWAVRKLIAVINVGTAIKNTAWLLWLLRREQVDLVHLNNGFVPAEALLATRISKVPCIVHLREFASAPLNDRLAPVDHVSRVIAVSDAVAKGLADLGFDPERITTIHDPVDIDRVTRSACDRARIRAHLGISDEDLAIGIFGRVVRWKGQHIFVEAAIAAMRANPRVRAVIVGDESDGQKRYFDGIRQMIAESGLADRFILTGYVTDVEAYYHAMDIVVHASIEPEPFGMVVPEAMTAGRAVIAVKVGGPAEVISDGLTGILVRPGDCGALTKAMELLLHDSPRRADIGSSAAHEARYRFSLTKNAAAVAAVYKTLFPQFRPDNPLFYDSGFSR